MKPSENNKHKFIAMFTTLVVCSLLERLCEDGEYGLGLKDTGDEILLSEFLTELSLDLYPLAQYVPISDMALDVAQILTKVYDLDEGWSRDLTLDWIRAELSA